MSTAKREKRKRRPRTWRSTTVVRWSVDARGCVVTVTTTTTGGAPC